MPDRARDFPLFKSGWGGGGRQLTHPLKYWVFEALHPGLQWWGDKADNSPLSSAEVKNL